MCINNVLGAHDSFGCGAGDASCLCKDVNFGYAIRDCSQEACGEDVKNKVVDFGAAYCAQATGGSVPSGSSTLTTIKATPTGGSDSGSGSDSSSSSVSFPWSLSFKVSCWASFSRV